MSNKKRIAYIDIMKGIAILSVVVGHYFSFPPLQVFIWSFHMPLFVFLNGYFFKDSGIWLRIKKSAVAYERPYLIVWMVLLVVECAISFFNGGEIWNTAKTRLLSGIWALASNRTYFIPEGVVKIGAIWFLNALFWGTLFLSIVLKTKTRIIQFVLVILLLLTGVLLTSKICIPLGLNYGVAFLMWLWVGYWYSALKKTGSLLVERIESCPFFYVFVLLWIVIILIEGVTHNQYNICWLRFPLFGMELIGAFSGIMVVMYISRLIEKHTHVVSNVLQNFGVSSLWILCVHALDIELFPHFEDVLNVSESMTALIRGVFDFGMALILHEGYQRINARSI